MRTGTVSYKLEDLKKGVIIPIGFVGENDFTRVIFDAEEIYKKYTNASVSMKVQPPKGGIYPATVTRDGNTVIWQVKEADVANRGGGELQLTFTDGETKIKTYIAKTDVKRSLAGNGPAPDPVQDWIDDAEDVLEEMEAAEIHQPIIGLDGYWYRWNQETGEYEKTNTKAQGADGHSPVLTSSKSGKTTTIFSDGTQLAQIQDGEDGQGADVIDDTSGEGDMDKTWSADKLTDEFGDILSEIHGIEVTPEMFGAKGDGETDDSQAVQAAVNAGYNVRFGDNKTYYLASAVNISHDCHLYGGKNTTIKTESVTENGTTTLNKAFVAGGSLKKTTTLTTDYYEYGSSDNSSNKFTLIDMTDINIGDLIEIVAEDQFYSYARPYYYLGGILLISEVRDGHIYTNTNLPFNIENTENVTVKIYNAPEIHIENLHFVSDRARVRFVFFVDFIRCKNSTIKNCEMTEAWNFVRFYRCFNSLADCIITSRSKYDNSLGVDSYAICIESCTNTIVQRMNGICGQDCISLTGTFPVINTYIRNCNVSGECRPVGIGLHENTYNIVVEDCDIGGVSLYGTAKVNRCRIFQNNRVGGDFGIVVRGNHNERYAKFEITDCIFNSNNSGFVSIGTQAPEEPIQSYDNIIGELIIKNCRGGFLRADASESPATILSNIVRRLIIDNWQNCYEIYHKSFVFEQIIIKDSVFTTRYWINKHTDSTDLSDIRLMRISSTNPMFERLFVDNIKNGGKYIMPSGNNIILSSSDNSAHYVICGKNLMPNDPTDMSVGSVSGSVGENLTRVVDANFSSALSADNGCLVYTQPNNTTKKYIYMKAFAYVEENGNAIFSVKIKNVGATDPATWKAYFARVDSSTGKILFRDAKGTATASSDGTTLSFNHGVYKGDLVLFYMYCSTPVANAVTKFENCMASLVPYGYGLPTPQFEEYDGVSRDGDGTLVSREGINNILSSASSFEAKFGTELFT